MSRLSALFRSALDRLRLSLEHRSRRQAETSSFAHLVRMDRAIWDAVLDELARRGGGVRESGAFLLAASNQTPHRVTEVVYFDDLDEEALTGVIHLRAHAFSRLWRLCREQGLKVIADVHTHPSRWVQQSGIDRDNPMVARDGHVALIVPDFAQGSRDSTDIGVHIYRGEQGWESYFGVEAASRLEVG